MLKQFLSAPYRDGGRGPAAYDCWGLCIAVRSQLLGLPLLPSLGAVGKDRLRENTHAYHDLKQGMEVCSPEVGAIAAVFRCALCLHVGVVVEADGRLKVLDTNPGGARIQTVREFETEFPRVVFYRDRIFPEQNGPLGPGGHVQD